MMSDGWTPDLIQAGEDARHMPLSGTVTVPLFLSTKMQVLVELGDPDASGMRPAFLIHDEILPLPLGYLAPTEGRWVLRDLVLAELIGRFNSRPTCDEQPCSYEKLRLAASAQGVADTWSLIVHGRCRTHQDADERAADILNDDDLIPRL